MGINRFKQTKKDLCASFSGLVLALFLTNLLVIEDAAAQSSIPNSVEQAIKRSGIPKSPSALQSLRFPQQRIRSLLREQL